MGNCIWIDLLETSFVFTSFVFIYCPEWGKCYIFNDVLTTGLEDSGIKCCTVLRCLTSTVVLIYIYVS